MRTIDVKGVSIGKGAATNANRRHSIRVRYKNERLDYIQAYSRRHIDIYDDGGILLRAATRGASSKTVQRRISVRRRSIRGVAGKDSATNLKRIEGYLERIFQQGFLSGLARYAPNNSGNLRNAGMFKLVVKVTPMGRSYALESPSKAHTTEKFRIALVIKPNPAARGAAAKDAYYTRLVQGGEDIRGLWTKYPDGVLRRVEYEKSTKRYYVKKRLKTRAFQFNRYREGIVIDVPKSSVFIIGKNETSTRPAQPNNFLDLAGKEGLRRVEHYLNSHGYFTMRVDPHDPSRIQESRLAGKAERTAILRAPALSYLYELTDGGYSTDNREQARQDRAYLFKARSQYTMRRALDRIAYEADSENEPMEVANMMRLNAVVADEDLGRWEKFDAINDILNSDKIRW